MKRYKFLRTGLKSENGNAKWVKGKWKTIKGELDMCHKGFHCSIKPYDAFSYVQGEICAEVEVRGGHLSEENKEVWSEMRIVKTFRWTKKDSVRLAIYSAELCLPNYEKLYENKAPRLAIEAAKKWLKTGKSKGLSAAWSAAMSAESAAMSARSAAWSARSAAWSARSAAWSAAWSAMSAESAAIKKIQTYFKKIVAERMK